jgi:hypothetical protein
MFEIRAYKTLAVIVSLGLVLAACGGQGQNDSVIATAVAQTVEANQSSAPLLAIPTSTSELPLTTPQPTLIPENTPTSAPTLVSAPSDPSCIHANLIGEYPPDGTVYKPGTAFTKSWTIKNEGTCTWDSTYKLIFWSGEIMGGSTYYDLPEVVQPGDDISIVVQFLAPTIEGNYTGYWRLQTPWNEVFGVGQYSQAFYANIVVDKKPGQEYGIVNLEYEIVRDPAEGCPANVEYTVYATITTNGPFDFNYYWAQKDGNDSAVKNMVFDEAGSKTISRSWLVGRGNSPNDRWMQIIVVWPELIEFPQATWPNNCP